MGGGLDDEAMRKQANWPLVVAFVLLVGLLVAASWASHPAWWRVHWHGALAALGIILNLGGIGLTVWAFRREHHARGLGSMWPGMAERLGRVRMRVRRLLPRSKTVRVHGATAFMSASVSASADGYVWRGVGDDADVEQRLALIAENLETLRDQVAKGEARLRERVDAVATDYDSRFTNLDQRLAAREADDAAITSRAIRWQVVGLVVASIGGLLTTVSTFG